MVVLLGVLLVPMTVSKDIVVIAVGMSKLETVSKTIEVFKEVVEIVEFVLGSLRLLESA